MFCRPNKTPFGCWLATSALLYQMWLQGHQREREKGNNGVEAIMKGKALRMKWNTVWSSEVQKRKQSIARVTPAMTIPRHVHLSPGKSSASPMLGQNVPNTECSFCTGPMKRDDPLWTPLLEIKNQLVSLRKRAHGRRNNGTSWKYQPYRSVWVEKEIMQRA